MSATNKIENNNFCKVLWTFIEMKLWFDVIKHDSTFTIQAIFHDGWKKNGSFSSILIKSTYSSNYSNVNIIDLLETNVLVYLLPNESKINNLQNVIAVMDLLLLFWYDWNSIWCVIRDNLCSSHVEQK